MEEEKQINPAKMKFNKDLPTVLYVIRDDGGCGFYRCHQPALNLRRMGLFNTITDFKTSNREHILQADIVVFQELGSPVSLEAFNFAIKNGKPTVIEVDDFLHVVSPNNPGYGAWNPGTLFLHRSVGQMERASAMTVATPQLAREYFPFNENIYVLPNFLSEDKWDNPQLKKKDGLLRIGWTGGNSHIDDLKLIDKVMEKIIKEYKDKVKFEIMGMVKEEMKGVFKGLDPFHETCPKCNYQGDTMVWSPETLDNYPQVLASHGWDIALAPVVNTAFNNAKSDLKLKEYAACGFPIVASRVTPYKEAVENGCSALLAENFKEWYNNIKSLIDNKEARDEMIKSNKEWIKRYWIEDNIQLYADTYNDIIKKHNPPKAGKN